MLRIFRAFAWLRWRVFVNSLERTGARDTLERLSIATEKLGPLIALALLIPSAVAVAGLALTAGYGAATGRFELPLQLIRYFLLLPIAFAVLAPVVLPTRGGTNVVRFLLLPVSRPILYAAHAAGALTDPWIVLMIPAVALIPVGLAAGGAWTAAVVAAVGGVALLIFVAGVTSLASSAVYLLLRNRRRGEIVMLVLVLVLPVVGFIPAALQARHRERPAAASEPAWMRGVAPRAFAWVPSELYAGSIGASTRGQMPAGSLAGLLTLGAGLQVAALAAFRRQLDVPSVSGARRAGTASGLWTRELPAIGAAASAVALAQVRLALRTPRGRSILAGPLLIFVVFALLMRSDGGATFAVLPVHGGLGLATFGGFVSLLAILPLAMNQFAVDGAGFTRYLLAPLDPRDVLRGKAAGNALIAAAPASGCVLLSALIFPSGHPAMWLALPLALVNTYVLAAPVAAALSAAFPRAVDLNSIGNGSNAHQAAALLGLAAFAACAAPNALLALLAASVLRQPWLTPLLLLGWGAAAYGLSRMLFAYAARFLASRTETLASM